jgi:hypothetical protein
LRVGMTLPLLTLAASCRKCVNLPSWEGVPESDNLT